MQKNEVVTVTIEDIGVNGEGIGRVNGYTQRAHRNACAPRGELMYTLFIKDSMIGDVVEAKIIKAKKSYGYARLMKILTPSKYRVQPKCEFARKCGGCQIQEMAYAQQLAFKQRKVKQNLERIGGFDAEYLEQIMEPIQGMEEPFGYRNKAQFPFGTDKQGNIITGFYAGRTHDIVFHTDCALGVPVNREILELTLRFMRKHHISAYDEKTGHGDLRHVLIRYGFTTKEIMVCFVLNRAGKRNFDRRTKGKRVWLPAQDELVKALAKIPGMTSISVSPHTEKSNVIMGDSFEVIWGQPYITDYIGKVKYQISPLSFYQVNPVQTEKLYGCALEYANLHGTETVWDLYCGIGTISLILAQRAKQVYGVEIVPQAVTDAKNNAKINGIENAKFYEGRAEDVLPDYYTQFAKSHPGQQARADVIVVDPPRKGCEESLLRTMVEMKAERIVYVSCDSATLARDLKYLCGEGYELKKVQVVDMFPMTVHTETVCLLSNRKLKPDTYIKLSLDMEDYYRIKDAEKEKNKTS